MSSAWQQRQDSVMTVDYEIKPGGDEKIDIEAAEHLEKMLNNINFNATFKQMHSGVFYGFSVAEMIWAYDGPHVIIERIKVRKKERFKFDSKTAKLKFLGGSNPQGEVLPENKMWIFVVPAEDNDTPPMACRWLGNFTGPFS